MNSPIQKGVMKRIKFTGLLLTKVPVLVGCPHCKAESTMCENSIQIMGAAVYAINCFVCVNCHRPFDYIFQELCGADAIRAREIINGLN